MTRAQTLVLAMLIMHLLLGALCLTAARNTPGRIALRQWGYGLLTYAGGLAVTVAAPYLFWRPIGLTMGNSLIALAPIACIQGVLANTSTRLPLRWCYGLTAALIALIAYNNFGPWHQIIVNLVAPSPLAVVLFLYAAVVLWRAPTAEASLPNGNPLACAKGPARFLAINLALCTVVWVGRITLMLVVLVADNRRDAIDLIVSLAAIVQIACAITCTLALFWIAVAMMEADLKRLAFADALTNLPNRRAVLDRFEVELARARRTDTPLALLVLDLDRFKQVNDRHGHLAGDALLAHVATVLNGAKRREDVLGRLGGEEFVCLLPGATGENAQIAADRLRARVADTPLLLGPPARGGNGRPIAITVSGGLASFPEDGADWDSLFATADQRLYQAKNAGRNQVRAG